MRILITGICGFVGSTLARTLLTYSDGLEIVGMDNFIRPGSELNRWQLRELGIELHHGDVRCASDLEQLSAVDFVIDSAANPSVLAGSDGGSSSRQLMEHNLFGTVNVLEFCKRHKAGLVMLSTSRVYSIPSLLSIPLEVHENAFRPLFRDSQTDMPLNPEAFGPDGLTEFFSTQSPVSIYGATKLASEVLSVEYGETFGFPVFINRCGVMAGAGQFGRADQGIFAFWVNSHLRRRPMNYIGFEGLGYQVRDCLHPRDLASLIMKQMRHDANIPAADRIMNCSGGIRSAMSLRQLTDWCDQRFGSHPVRPEPGNRPFDIPWLVLDPSKAMKYWDWQPAVELENILEEIAAHALENPDWLRISALH